MLDFSPPMKTLQAGSHVLLPSPLLPSSPLPRNSFTWVFRNASSKTSRWREPSSCAILNQWFFWVNQSISESRFYIWQFLRRYCSIELCKLSFFRSVSLIFFPFWWQSNSDCSNTVAIKRRLCLDPAPIKILLYCIAPCLGSRLKLLIQSLCMRSSLCNNCVSIIHISE